MRAKFHGALFLTEVFERSDLIEDDDSTYWVSKADMIPFSETYSTFGLDLKASMAD